MVDYWLLQKTNKKLHLWEISEWNVKYEIVWIINRSNIKIHMKLHLWEISDVQSSCRNLIKLILCQHFFGHVRTDCICYRYEITFEEIWKCSKRQIWNGTCGNSSTPILSFWTHGLPFNLNYGSNPIQLLKSAQFFTHYAKKRNKRENKGRRND